MTRSILSILGGLALITAACQPAGQTATAVLPDSATVHAALQAAGDSFEAAELAGDAAAVGQHYTEDATAALDGMPTTTGRANLEALFGGFFSTQKVTRAEIMVTSAGASAPTVATAGGTASFDNEVNGTTRTDNWRWAAEYRLGTDGQWRISYHIAFLEVPATPTP